MINIDTMGYFITGSDTDAGKTYIACEIIRQLCDLNIDIEVRKPAESGCREDAGGNLIAADATLLNQANGENQALTTIAPYRFRAALAPHRAARLEGIQLYLHNLIEACEHQHSGHRLIVEGAGGFYSPLAEDALNADLASALQLPVIIVVNDRIGAVNQALMTIAAVESRHLRIAAIIMNQVSADHETDMDNLTDLEQYCDYPLLRCMHRQPLENLFRPETQRTMKRLPAPWVFVTTGIIFNILSAVITHYFIGINNAKIVDIDRQANNKQVLIDSLWQSKTEIERKEEFFILLLQNDSAVESELVDQIYLDYIRDTISTHSLSGFAGEAVSAMRDSKLLLKVSAAAQISIIESINTTYLEKTELEDKKVPIEKNNARLFSFAIFLQITGLILVLARDLSKR